MPSSSLLIRNAYSMNEDDSHPLENTFIAMCKKTNLTVLNNYTILAAVFSGAATLLALLSITTVWSTPIYVAVLTLLLMAASRTFSFQFII